ncbi:hypothetical protein IGI04_003080, partial [Brassica rapa subsp. trilocularis]
FGLPLGLFLRLGLHSVQQRGPIKRLVKQDLFHLSCPTIKVHISRRLTPSPFGRASKNQRRGDQRSKAIPSSQVC